jgi:hypothetical protein
MHFEINEKRVFIMLTIREQYNQVERDQMKLAGRKDSFL